MEGDDLLDVGEAEAEAFHVVDVAGMHTVELVEDLLHVLFLDAKTGIADGETEAALLVPGLDIEVERLFGFALLHGIVHQVGDGVLEVYFIDEDG